MKKQSDEMALNRPPTRTGGGERSGGEEGKEEEEKEEEKAEARINWRKRSRRRM